jgi:hypothetical protein
MSYDPSHRRPPRQERWPQATPPTGWPSYRDDDAYPDAEQADRRYAADRQGAYRATAGYPREAGYQDVFGGYEDRGYQSAVVTDTFPPDMNGYGGNGNGYGGGTNGYGGAAYGYADPDFAGSPAYLGPGSYTEPGLSDSRLADSRLADPRLADPRLADPMLVAPDTGVDPYRWQAEQDLRREARRRGLAVGAVTGFLATGAAIGVSTLVAGFAKLQASPMSSMGSVFIDRLPAALRNAATHHFGAHGRTVLLFGMYVAIAILAVGIGVLARHAAASGVACLMAFSLIAAFVTITRPGGHVSDVAPAIIGGVAGVVALLWLMRASAPAQRAQRPQGAASLQYVRGGARRRTR